MLFEVWNGYAYVSEITQICDMTIQNILRIRISIIIINVYLLPSNA